MNTAEATGSPPGRTGALLRRLAANTYDALLLFALWVAAAAPLAIVFAIAHHSQSPLLQEILRGYLPLVGLVYFSRAWLKTGQTPGMRAWGLAVRVPHGRLGIGRALLRYVLALLWWVSLIEGLTLSFQGHYLPATILLALFGSAYFWIFLDPESQCLHDRLSGTRVLFVPRSPRARQKPQADEAQA